LDFIQSVVRSVWAVELMLVLRQDAERVWSAADLVRELRGSPALVAENLGLFTAGGIVDETEPGRFKYRPASPALAELCDELDREYRQRPVTVMQAILARRNSKVQSLADAFRFRGGDK
jgi:hypothetical protein